MSENNEREITETFEFEIDAKGNFDPNSGTTSFDGEQESSNKGSNSTVAVSDSNEEEVTSENEVVELDTVDGTDTSEKKEKEESNEDEMTFDFGEEEKEEETQEDNPEEDRIAQLEKKIAELENNKSFEEKYSKEKMVMPGISEYDYALMGKDFAEKGKLTDEQYAKLEELGYSREVVDSFGNQQIQAAKPEPQAEVTQEQVRAEAAKEMDMEISEFDSLLEDVGKVFTQAQKDTFENSNPEQQIKILQNFRVQKLQHEQKLKDRKLIKGNSGATNDKPKSPFADLTDKQLEKANLEAIYKGESQKVMQYSAELMRRGLSPNF